MKELLKRIKRDIEQELLRIRNELKNINENSKEHVDVVLRNSEKFLKQDLEILKKGICEESIEVLLRHSRIDNEDTKATNIREIIEANKENADCEEFKIRFNHTYLKEKNFGKLKKKFCLRLKEIIGTDNFNYIISNENKFDNCLKNVIRECDICFSFAVKKEDIKDTEIYINVFLVFKKHFKELIEEGK